MTTTDGAAAEIPSDDEIPALRVEIDQLDAEILRLVKRRSEVSQRIGRGRKAAGGPRSGPHPGMGGRAPAARPPPGGGRSRPVGRPRGGGPRAGHDPVAAGPGPARRALTPDL